ncbi:MAG: sigma-54-dependent Fis family transcriptional regulator [Planctomycetota bacterium]|nr:MAG: sigma-54-dependent Fis family transcriptional regulator [Planctomycetota bacterium]
MSVLLIDDDPGIRKLLSRELKRRELAVDTAADGAQGLSMLDRVGYDVVVCDVRMPDMDGLEVLRRIKEREPDITEVIMLTGHGTIDSAIEAIKAGAYHYLTKPVKVAELAALIANAAERAALRRDNVLLRREVASRRASKQDTEVVLGESPAWKRAWKTIGKAGPTESTVLILGKSGTGKEIAARELHRLSPRARRPFVAVNCASVATSLLESELFGHEAGAFTSAQKRRRGLFELAHGGTLFLDEVAETSVEFQANLLRVLETGEYRRVGGDVSLSTDVRLIAATNRNLKEEIEKGRFREDLFYRLNVVSVELPELKDRYGDVEILAQHFLKEFDPTLSLSPEALALLARYPWPGNVRELRNVIERMSILAEGKVLTPDDLPGDVRAGAEMRVTPPGGTPGGNTPLGVEQLPPSLADVERVHIEEVLRFTGGNKARAARILGITAATLYNKLKAYKARDAKKEAEAASR